MKWAQQVRQNFANFGQLLEILISIPYLMVQSQHSVKNQQIAFNSSYSDIYCPQCQLDKTTAISDSI